LATEEGRERRERRQHFLGEESIRLFDGIIAAPIY
jgi:hypothetical protein